MLKILVVDDDLEKMRQIIVCLQGMSEADVLSINTAHDASEAKGLLRSNAYDLLILDIALPPSADRPLAVSGGIDLLREILERDIYHRPREIVGLTAYAEVMDTAAPIFATDLWLVILYDPASDAWAEQLKRKVRHLILAARSGGAPDFGCQLCVLTALPDPELQAVLALPWHWDRYDQPCDSTQYQTGWFERNGDRYQVYAASSPRMGMTTAAVIATKMILTFRPRYFAMVGIAAAVRGQCDIGDIIAIDPTWDWGSGKRILKSGKPQFAPAPHQIALDPFIRGKLVTMSQDSSILDDIRNGWRGAKTNNVLRMHVGPVASGAAVLQDQAVVDSILTQHRKLLGVEMESYGVLAAAHESPLPIAKAFSLKSVCDFADSQKDDTYQSYAAYTSAEALRVFMERYL